MNYKNLLLEEHVGVNFSSRIKSLKSPGKVTVGFTHKFGTCNVFSNGSNALDTLEGSQQLLTSTVFG